MGPRAFTIVEVLVVIAITAVLFFLLIGPLVNSFRLTQRAQMLVGAQDSARRTMEMLSRELGSAAYVFDNTTHPFVSQNAMMSQYNEDQFTNFLDMEVPQNDGTISPLLAHAYNAKLDFVLPAHTRFGQLIDPTTGDPITIKNGQAASTPLTFPLAPGTTMVRYFVGLRDPTKPYGTHGEGSLLARNGNNTYVLYRAQFQPYNTIDPNTGKPTVNPDGTTVNETYFSPQHDSQGNAKNVPEFDEPNFFRNVVSTDVDWLDPTHATYGSTPLASDTVALHNMRVQNWFQLAKPIISSSNTDLILLPHNTDNSVAYGTVTPPAGDPNAASFAKLSAAGFVVDPVTASSYPTVNTSVTFRFAGVASDASAAANADYASAGVGSDAAANAGLPYVPAVYTATDQSWAFPYHIALYQNANTAQPLFDTQVASSTDTNAPPLFQAGDLMEMYNNVPVYDVSSGVPITISKYPNQYVPMVVNPDTGIINFDTPALPQPSSPPPPAVPTTPADPYNRFFWVPVTQIAQSGGLLDLSTLTASLGQQTNPPGPAMQITTPSATVTSPLPTVTLDGSAGPNPTGYQVANARIVPGTVRVYGPDAYPGPNYGQPVAYTEVFPGDANGPQDNQYQIDYAHNYLRLFVNDLAGLAGQYPMTAISISFDYQANLAPTDPSTGSAYTPITEANPAFPLTVKVDYQTRDLLDVSLGVRVYDPNNVGPAQIVTVRNQVRVGNSNR